ncbi:MAG: DUF3592 domain-containing protein [Chloroflexi bacterium]|nr:DUF3592 domain-containing protein [Chloroflexota bacterium]
MKITGIILWIIGVVILAVGGYLLVRERLFQQSAEQATAVATDNKQYTYTSSDNGVQHYYCTGFQFQTKDGRNISFKEDDSTDVSCADLDMPPDYQVGQQVPVYYDPRDPAGSVQIPKSVSLNYDSGAIVLAAGALCIVIGMGSFWFGLTRGRQNAAPKASRY